MNITGETIDALKQQLSSEELQQKTIRFFGVQGYSGPSVQMAVVDEAAVTDQVFEIDEVNFALDQDIKEQPGSVTLTVGHQGFKPEGLAPSNCC